MTHILLRSRYFESIWQVTFPLPHHLVLYYAQVIPQSMFLIFQVILGPLNG